ncbi:hypothetical protein [uncultured Lutibacter sp.]|uniref:hypothetical protein n=1 Tax=uncultured Lutibacter sp. TaxID=437739 RepID=UPI00260F0197|nr:hypothetical protein [uncultured Lutibacter sp.]
MNISLKIFISLLLFFSASIAVFAQTDTPKIKRIDNEINTTKSTNQLQAKSFKPASNQNIDLRIDKKLDIDVINKNLNTNKSNSNSTFLMETLPENNDIIGKKYWKGKDITHAKLKSNFSLGTITSSTKSVKIECRDYSAIDGDRIRIYLNEQIVSDNIGLKSNYYVYYIDLEKGYNRIDFQALNQGLSGPNTAELAVYDANGNLISSKEWNLTTGQTATIGIIQQ